MKSALITHSLSFVIAFSTTSCILFSPSHRPSSENPQAMLEWGIKEFNAGTVSEAKVTLESVIEATAARELAEIRAVAHFYLAAVAWDFEETAATDLHLRQCLNLRPNYQPDWTFLSSGLRQRYETLR